MWVIEASKAFGGDFVPACHPWEMLRSQLFASSDPEKMVFVGNVDLEGVQTDHRS